jgi:hypothetical protein
LGKSLLAHSPFSLTPGCGCSPLCPHVHIFLVRINFEQAKRCEKYPLTLGKPEYVCCQKDWCVPVVQPAGAAPRRVCCPWVPKKSSSGVLACCNEDTERLMPNGMCCLKGRGCINPKTGETRCCPENQLCVNGNCCPRKRVCRTANGQPLRCCPPSKKCSDPVLGAPRRCVDDIP